MSEYTLTVTILDKDYQVSCPESEQESLLSSARFLDEKMQEIKESGNVIGLERIAVMAALNITHELLQEGSEKGAGAEHLQRLADKIARALGNQSQLQL